MQSARDARTRIAQGRVVQAQSCGKWLTQIYLADFFRQAGLMTLHTNAEAVMYQLSFVSDTMMGRTPSFLDIATVNGRHSFPGCHTLQVVARNGPTAVLDCNVLLDILGFTWFG